MNLPSHLAIIMDGNGRWAMARKHNRLYGHVRGAHKAKKIIEASAKLGIKNLSLFTFSNENWSRPEEEVQFLMKLFVRQIKREVKSLMENNIRFSCIGNLSLLPQEVQKVIDFAKEKTQLNTGMNLVFAISYGGRQEILQAAQRLAKACKDGEITPEQINENTFRENLSSSFVPDPDLIIRTSGESRLSNFYLWQSAYSEFYISEKLWPDFDVEDLKNALIDYEKCERRFGKTSDQVKSLNTTKDGANSTCHP